MTAPTIKAKYGLTYHRDGTASYWDVYRQQWQRTSAYALTNKHDVYASLPDAARKRISKMALSPR